MQLHILCNTEFTDIESKTFGIDPVKLQNYLEKILNLKIVSQLIKTLKKNFSFNCCSYLGNSCDIKGILKFVRNLILN